MGQWETVIWLAQLPNEGGCLEAARMSRPIRTANTPFRTTLYIIFHLVPTAGLLSFTAVVRSTVVAAYTVPRTAYPRVDVRVAAFEQGSGKRWASEEGGVSGAV